MSLSWSRWVGIIVKEFIQLKRDRLTFGMIIGIPVLQLVLFGYAINADPKRLPTAVLAADSGPYARSLVAALQTSGYFRLDRQVAHEEELERLLARGQVDPRQIGALCLHGTGTRMNDVSESRALERVFGPALADVPGFGIKGALGHLMGAAGGVEMAVAALSLSAGCSRSCRRASSGSSCWAESRRSCWPSDWSSGPGASALRTESCSACARTRSRS